MARSARAVSESGYYHVVLRGNGKQLLFEDDLDRHAFIDAAAEQFAQREVVVIAWCLMDNHVHLLLRDDARQLSRAMQALATKYAQRFNRKGGHAGHVFQERFASFPVESDSYLLEAVRYIHNNPAKAGVCPVDEHWWSSYREYVGKAELADTSIVLDMLGGVDALIAFQAADAAGRYRLGGGHRIPDEEMGEVAAAVLAESFGCAANEVKALPKPRRNECLVALHDVGLSIRQIGRLTGIGDRTIARVASSKMA
ncbi:transposase [Arabiibacter massiliensis]|uniref:transposase n=1 Tax=Arabiibacter massiliensis TaxID=1870985 RepID=UPI0009BC3FD9|nr:transposase [Arabiibacter massiliensis]